MHHDRRLHQMMLAEDCKAWDVRFGALQEKQLSHRPATAASTRLAELSSGSACLPSHGSPTDSASSLHAECLLTQDSAGEDAGSSTFRCMHCLCRTSLSIAAPDTQFDATRLGRYSSMAALVTGQATLLWKVWDTVPVAVADMLLVCRSTKHSKPDVSIVRCKHTGYWLVNISCKDRNKLLFDTVSDSSMSIPSPSPCTQLNTGCYCCTVSELWPC